MSLEHTARLLAEARREGGKLADYPEAGPADENEALQLQLKVREALGWRQTGWKIGCTSKLAQDLLGTSQPFPGPLFAERSYPSGAELTLHAKAQCIVEPEIAFTMARDLPARPGTYTVDEVLKAVASVHPGLELIDRRAPGTLSDGNLWNIADGGCNDAFVLGPAAEPLPADAYAQLELEVTRNGAPATRGIGANALGGAHLALAWLANFLNRHNMMVRKGDVITTGVVTGLVYVESGDEVVSSCERLGTVSSRFAA